MCTACIACHTSAALPPRQLGFQSSGCWHVLRLAEDRKLFAAFRISAKSVRIQVSKSRKVSESVLQVPEAALQSVRVRASTFRIQVSESVLKDSESIQCVTCTVHLRISTCRKTNPPKDLPLQSGKVEDDREENFLMDLW